MENYIDRKKMQLVAASCRKCCKTFTKRKDWFIRVKVPLPETLANEVKSGVAKELDLKEATSYQICLEGSNETDHHIQLCAKFKHDNEKSVKSWAKQFYEEMIKTYKVNTKKISTFYSCVRIRENALRAMAYNYKEDKHVIEKNVDEEDIKIAKLLSHGKDLRQLSKRLESLKERYYRDEIGDVGLAEGIMLIKTEFNQNINIGYIQSMVRYIMIKKNPVYARSWAIDIINNIKGNN